MSKWIDFTIDERKAMIQAVSEEKQIDEASAEKDWWVTAVLYAIFHTSIGEYLLFKGGTSLSKGWNIINRFSEDIDLALSRDFFLNVKSLACANCTSNTQIHHLREKAQDYILGDFKSELKEELKRLGLPVTVIGDNDVLGENGEPLKVPHDKDPSVIFVKYPSLYQSNAAYATPTVKIEISVLSMAEPFEMRRISSLVEQAFDGKHIYEDIVNHRRKFYHVGYVDYDKELPQSILIVPSDALLPSYEADYNEMRGSFIYGESLDFSALMKRMAELQERFRKISTEQ